MATVNRRDFLRRTACTAAGAWLLGADRTGARAAASDAGRPNVILILADDLGYETLGANGGTSYKTPVLDKLAAEGARFDYCFAQPLCTPTRVQLMTGIYNVRNYTRFGHMDPTCTTFAHLFKRAGYATCITGKWQLGQDVDLPKTFGFDESCLWQHTRRPPRYANPGLEINGRQKDYANGEYGPDLINAYALDFVSRCKDKPFFLYYPMVLTHDPYQPTPDSGDWDPKARGEQVNRHVRHFGEMVTYMDKLIGRLVAKLDELHLRENTLLLFVGDNGTGGGATSHMGERVIKGGKGKTISTGMHVPLVASWPAKIKAGSVCRDLVDTTDFLPTICQAAGIAPPEGIDGRSFLPQLAGRDAQPRQWVYCWFSREGSVRAAREFAFDHRYKLYRDGAFYQWSADPQEKSPLGGDKLDAQAGEARKRLQAALDRYRDARPEHLKKGQGAGVEKPSKKKKKK